MPCKNIKHWEILSEDISVKLYKLTFVELKFSVLAKTIIFKTYSSPESKILFYRPCMLSKLFSTIFLIQDLGHNYFQNFSAGFFLDHPTDINERKRGNTKALFFSGFLRYKSVTINIFVFFQNKIVESKYK